MIHDGKVLSRIYVGLQMLDAILARADVEYPVSSFEAVEHYFKVSCNN